MKTQKQKSSRTKTAVGLRRWLGYDFIYLEDLIEAITDLKYYIDIQNPKTMFHSSGEKIKDLPGYKKADLFLNKLLAYNTKRSKKPNKMLIITMPISNVITKNSSRTPSDSFNTFPEV